MHSMAFSPSPSSLSNSCPSSDLFKLTEPLHDTLFVVIRPARGLASLLEPNEHDFLGAREEDDGRGRADRVVELVRLIHLTREAIDEESRGHAH